MIDQQTTTPCDQGPWHANVPNLEDNVEWDEMTPLSSAPLRRGGTVKDVRVSSFLSPSVTVVRLVNTKEPGPHRYDLLALDSKRHIRGFRSFRGCF